MDVDAMTRKGNGKGGKSKGKGKGGKDKEKGSSKSKDTEKEKGARFDSKVTAETVVHGEGASTERLLVATWKASEQCGN